LRYPKETRPVFIAGYFSLIDTLGHDFGPDSEEVKAGVQYIDSLIGQLYSRLRALPIKVNLILVSDHGMTNVDKNQIIEEKSLPITDDFIVLNEGEQLLLYAKQGVSSKAIAEQYKILSQLKLKGVHVLDNQQRKRYNMPVNSRTGDIIINIEPPAKFVKADTDKVGPGGHGYFPEHPDMGAFFVAVGPAFEQGVVIPAISNLEVYPTLADILNIKVLTPIDGKVDALRPALKRLR